MIELMSLYHKGGGGRALKLLEVGFSVREMIDLYSLMDSKFFVETYRAWFHITLMEVPFFGCPQATVPIMHIHV